MLMYKLPVHKQNKCVTYGVYTQYSQCAQPFSSLCVSVVFTHNFSEEQAGSGEGHYQGQDSKHQLDRIFTKV